MLCKTHYQRLFIVLLARRERWCWLAFNEWRAPAAHQLPPTAVSPLEINKQKSKSTHARTWELQYVSFSFLSSSNYCRLSSRVDQSFSAGCTTAHVKKYFHLIKIIAAVAKFTRGKPFKRPVGQIVLFLWCDASLFWIIALGAIAYSQPVVGHLERVEKSLLPHRASGRRP